MEIGVSLKSLEHVTPRVERNLATGFVRTVSIIVGTTEYRYWFGGLVQSAAGWHERCTLYTDSEWVGIRGNSELAIKLYDFAGVAALTAENTKLLGKAVG